MHDTMTIPGHYDLNDAARVIGIHPQSLRRLVKQGHIPASLRFGKYLLQHEAVWQFATAYDSRPGRKRYPAQIV